MFGNSMNDSDRYILVVDDDEVVRDETIRVLSEEDPRLEFKQFSDGESAFHFLQEAVDSDALLPAVILLDLMMPKMNGIELLEAMQELSDRAPLLKSIPIFTVTGCEFSGLRNYCADFDSVAAVVRKFDSAQIVRSVVTAASSAN